MLSLPSITRKTDKGLPKYDDGGESDVFLLSGAEDLVPEFKKDAQGNWLKDPNGGFRVCEELRSVDGAEYRVRRYRPRTEGLFSRIERWVRVSDGDMHWRTISKANVTSLYGLREHEAYGQPVGSRISDPNTPNHVFAWLICKSYDDKGNALAYSYVSENSDGVDFRAPSEANRTDIGRSANRYLKRIEYGNTTSILSADEKGHVSPFGPERSGLQWHFEMVFDYGEGHVEIPDSSCEKAGRVRASASGMHPWRARRDAFSKHRSGFEIRTYRRCERILLFHHFESELPTPDYLVRSLDFDYAETGITSYLRTATSSGYVYQSDGTYLRRSLPPLEFQYTRSPLEDFDPGAFPIRDLDAASLKNLPAGTSDGQYQWADLDGEGIAGLLTAHARTWFYKPNLGGGRLGPLTNIGRQPSTITALPQLMDLAGDGQLDLVQLDTRAPGFYKRSVDGGWTSFRPFADIPNVEWSSPNLRFADLSGDGLSDVLIVDGDELTWFESEGEQGFDFQGKWPFAHDERDGPRLLFTNPKQAVFLADLSGDGLPDLVRVRQGEVCYWPNVGYGRFGGKVTMENAPYFDSEDVFDPRRIHLADTDGSGVADLIYDGRSGVEIYLNQAGNGWSGVRRLTSVPRAHSLSSLATVDLLGSGTICLVWSSSGPNDFCRAVKYVDLMNGKKPHLLVHTANNLGAETQIEYASSTQFYLEDKARGEPWITRLPFPVHVVTRVETFDRINRNRFVSRFAYHHGYFDGVEREFRGFGMVEQWDTEEFASLNRSGQFPTGENVDVSSHVPPVLTRTWFHTGVYRGSADVSNHFAGLSDARHAPLSIQHRSVHGSCRSKYYREPRAREDDDCAREVFLGDTILPQGLSFDEQREACRSLRGLMLRQEVYGLDDTGTIDDPFGHPYVVTEQNFTIKPLQPQGQNCHSVFFTHVRESLTTHYERRPQKPRVAHAMTVEVDAYGNVLKSVDIAYGLRGNEPPLSPRDRATIQKTLITFTENRVTNAILGADEYRVPAPAESSTCEITGYRANGTERFRFADFFSAGAAPELIFDSALCFEEPPTVGRQCRLIAHSRTLYRRNDLSGPLPLGVLESRAIPYENYQLALTSGLVSEVFSDRVNPELLEKEARYVADNDGDYWIPSGRIFYSANPDDLPNAELAYALGHFFQPCRYRNPFHSDEASTDVIVRYDAYDVLVLETCDALGNRTTAGTRDAGPEPAIAFHALDYRVLQPALVMDANRNRAAVTFDALGMVVGTAVMGKPEENLGDSLDGFEPNLPDDVAAIHLRDPLKDPEIILKRATTRLVYDLFAYFNSKDQVQCEAPVVYELARETHESDLPAGETSKIQHRFTYSDGFGHDIQKKMQAESGPVPKRDESGRMRLIDGQSDFADGACSPRWVGSGWTIFNNKGKPVRQFEPFFTDTHRFEFGTRVGVGSILFYDPVGRVIGTVHPNHTWEKAVFDAWSRQTWDVNDTVLIADPANDPHVGPFFSRLPDEDYLPTWYAPRIGGALGPAEQRAAQKTAVHAGTSSVAYLDPLGRSFLTVEHNRFESHGANRGLRDEFYSTHSDLNIQGSVRHVIDAADRIVMRYEYDVLGNRLHSASMEAGERWMLNDILGKPLRTWDSREHSFRTTFDQLRRPLNTYLQRGSSPEIAVQQVIYGEGEPAPESSNVRTRAVETKDQAGSARMPRFDFKGNLLLTERLLAKEYRQPLDWQTTVELEDRVYRSRTRFDALNRPVEVTAPDGSVTRPTFNESNLLQKIDVALAGDTTATVFVSNVNYNAKGQRTRIDYGNGTTTTYDYDPLTFRLNRLQTRRKRPAPTRLQDLNYTYDPAGNITSLIDRAQQTIYFKSRRVDPSADYVYDAIYRLVQATGREHLGQNGQPEPSDAFDLAHVGFAHPGDGNAMGRYRERYEYDAVGNILEMRHRSTSVPHPGWTRSYRYDETSLVEADKSSNRLSSTRVAGSTERYTYDDHGNMTRMAHLPTMQWDFRDQLSATTRTVGAGAETTYYVYDSNGERVRKVTETADGRRRSERIYIGSFEVYRKYESDGDAVQLERQTLHVMDDNRRVAMVERRTRGTEGEACLVRLQLSTHLGTACIELDQDSEVISYEEYFTYGATSYQAVRTTLTSNPKRYRYTGKERDGESGLYYHFARYYASWLGRWTSADPQGLSDGANSYVYCRNNALAFCDPSGTEAICDPKAQSCLDPTAVTNAPAASGYVPFQENSCDPQSQTCVTATSPARSSLDFAPGETGTTSTASDNGFVATLPHAVRFWSRIPRSAVRVTEAVKDVAPTTLGLAPSGLDSTLSTAEHALGEHLPTESGSPFISASMNPRGAPNIQGDLQLWIDIDKATQTGSGFISQKALATDMARLVDSDPGKWSSRAEMWSATQKSEAEVLFKGIISPKAIDTALNAEHAVRRPRIANCRNWNDGL